MSTKHILWLAFVLIMIPAIAIGAAATDITDSCDYQPFKNVYKRSLMYDNDYTTYWHVPDPTLAYIDVTNSQDQEIGGVYIKWYKYQPKWHIDVLQDDQWVTVAQYTNEYMVEYITLPPGTTSFRLCRAEDDTTDFMIAEMRIYSPGEPPDGVQAWEPTLNKCDILVISTHPDDELLYMGGTIAYYLAQGKTVQVVYMTTVTSYRRLELHDGLWLLGMRNYPILGPFTDKMTNSLVELYKRYWPVENVKQFLVECIRKCKPEVIVTHDLNGEYGHMEHIATARNSIWAVENASDESYDPETAALYGPWQVKKLYLHLYEDNAVVMDWTQPLDFYNGESALSMTIHAFELHVSQARNNFHEVKIDGPYDCRLFGLYHSTVGDDVLKNDFLENIP